MGCACVRHRTDTVPSPALRTEISQNCFPIYLAQTVAVLVSCFATMIRWSVFYKGHFDFAGEGKIYLFNYTQTDRQTHHS